MKEYSPLLRLALSSLAIIVLALMTYYGFIDMTLFEDGSVRFVLFNESTGACVYPWWGCSFNSLPAEVCEASGLRVLLHEIFDDGSIRVEILDRAGGFCVLPFMGCS